MFYEWISETYNPRQTRDWENKSRLVVSDDLAYTRIMGVLTELGIEYVVNRNGENYVFVIRATQEDANQVFALAMER